jgi:hypothetical protein
MTVRLVAACLLAGGSWQVAFADLARATSMDAECKETEPIRDQPPSDPHASAFGHGPWYINSSRTMWADPWHPWTDSAKGLKVLWIRPPGQELRITGRRIDGNAPPLVAHVPCCYPWTYQSTRLTFPTPGCWEVAGTAGSETLIFTVAVAPAPPNQALPDNDEQTNEAGASEEQASAGGLLLPGATWSKARCRHVQFDSRLCVRSAEGT